MIFKLFCWYSQGKQTVIDNLQNIAPIETCKFYICASVAGCTCNVKDKWATKQSRMCRRKKSGGGRKSKRNILRVGMVAI